MHRFLVVFEKADGNYSVFSPDLPVCMATGGTAEEGERNLHETIMAHTQGLKESGFPVPQSQSPAEYMVVPV